MPGFTKNISNLGVCKKRLWQALLLGLAILIGTSTAANAALVTFDWSDPNPRGVGTGTVMISVDLTATQTAGADAAAITLGFSLSGIITDVSLNTFGGAVSVSDSFFGDLGGGQIGIIAVAPASPGSFGQDVDFTIATLDLTLTGAVGSGDVTLVDLTAVAGAPALEMNGTTVIPSDLSSTFTVNASVIPEPTSLLLTSLGLLGLRAHRRSQIS